MRLTGIVEQLSLDLQAAFPYETGVGSRNIWYMKRWYLFYSEKIQQLVGQLGIYQDKILHPVGAEMQEAKERVRILEQEINQSEE